MRFVGFSEEEGVLVYRSVAIRTSLSRETRITRSILHFAHRTLTNVGTDMIETANVPHEAHDARSGSCSSLSPNSTLAASAIPASPIIQG